MKARPVDERELEDLVARAARGDEPAWQRLWELLEPRLLQLTSDGRFLGPVGRNEDDRRNLVVDVMARLRDDRFHRLRLYLAARAENPGLRFWTWLRVVTKRVGIDYLRGHQNYVDRRRNADASTPGTWIEARTLPPASLLPGGRPPVTLAGTARELLRHADATFPARLRQAIELWIQGHDHDEIARTLGLDHARMAERLVHAGIERLRRQFRSGTGAS